MVVLILGFHLYCTLVLISLRQIDPLLTTVQVQRGVECLLGWRECRWEYRFVPLERIAKDLQYAVIASEDGRFYSHRGIDWHEMRIVIRESRERGRLRGASTISQQLVKNLFFTTHRLSVRKLAEFTIVPIAEFVLEKDRILELYLNVVEWGPGIYGAEAAARHHYDVRASALTREQSARLAAILPAPLQRKPAEMNGTSARIIERMQQMGW
ncbi:MAG: monofunctional biosynthetic peptidoglycan transglycosylase [Bryobacteraceae bacterium]